MAIAFSTESGSHYRVENGRLYRMNERPIVGWGDGDCFGIRIIDVIVPPTVGNPSRFKLDLGPDGPDVITTSPVTSVWDFSTGIATP